MSAALEHLDALEAPNKFAILGDMFELGTDSASEHLRIAEHADALNLDSLLLVGNAFSVTKTEGKRFNTFEALVEFLKSNPISGPGTLLIKASRGMALERLVDHLYQGLSPAIRGPSARRRCCGPSVARSQLVTGLALLFPIIKLA